MNERIKELAAEAGMLTGWQIGEVEWKKFAELIVKECIAECWYDATPKQISDNIKMKFGVD